MDKQRRRKREDGDSCSHSSSIRNSNRSNSGSRPQTHPGYMQEWIYHTRPYLTATPQYDPQLCGPFWEMAGPAAARMFPAFSDPSVCRYSVPPAHPSHVAYSYEPVSLPSYQLNAYHQPPTHGSGKPWRSPHHVAQVPSRNRNKNIRSPREHHSPGRKSQTSHHKAKKTKEVILNHKQEEYLSLPPGIHHGFDLDDSQRRFSDPGLAHPQTDANTNENCDETNENDQRTDDRSEEWAKSSSTSVESAILTSEHDGIALAEQLNMLRADNRRLAQELRQTRAELHKLKLEANAWNSSLPPDYQPGMIADLVREVRDATLLREETLLSRLQFMMSDGGVLSFSGSQSSPKEEANLFRQTKDVNTFTADHSDNAKETDVRLARLEKQMNNLQLGHDSGAGEDMRREEILHRELQKAKSFKKAAESNVYRLERLLSNGNCKGSASDDKNSESPTDCNVKNEGPSTTLESMASVGCSSQGSGSGSISAPVKGLDL